MAKGKGKGSKQPKAEKTAAGVCPASGELVPGLFPVKPARQAGLVPPGRTVALISNLFRMSLDQRKPIHEVYVSMDWELEKKAGDVKKDAEAKDGQPSKIGNEFRRAVVDKAIKTWITNNQPRDYNRDLAYNYIFDAGGSIIYSLFDIFASTTDDTQEFIVSIEVDSIVQSKLAKETKRFRVKFHKGQLLNLSDLFDYCARRISGNNEMVQKQIRALNVILRGKINTIPSMVLTQFNIFPYRKENQFKVSPGVIINQGYSTSVRPAECGLILNVANTVGAFHEEIDLIELIKSRFGYSAFNQGLRLDIVEMLKKEIKNKQVEARHINYGTKNKPHYRKYRVGDIGGSCKDKFNLVDHATKQTREVTIAEYFKSEYNIKLKYPELPCILDKGRKLPLELCHLIEKQRVLRKMDPNETAAIIKKSALQPKDHFERVMANAKQVHQYSEPLNDFGLSFEPKPIDVNGRELSPIALLGASKRPIQPSRGEYMAKDKFFKPAKINKWGLCYLMDRYMKQDKQKNGPNELFGRKFSESYMKEALSKGVNINGTEMFNFIDIERAEKEVQTTLKRYFEHLNEQKIDHVIFLLPGKCPDWMYRYLQFMEVTTGKCRPAGQSWTRSSCVKYQNYMSKIIGSRDDGRMFLANLWLKYNTKFGGINFALNHDRSTFLNDGYIFISVDVCHPAPGDKLIQSVAAVVGMWDLTNQNMSYCTKLRVQRKMREDHSTIEQVGEIKIMVGEVLDAYRNKKNKYPTHIVILRDGVSEGQFKIVLNYEVSQIRGSFDSKYKNNKLPSPKLSCLVVQKRHKVRFMRKEPVKTYRGDDYNIQPGTVVDSVVTHPTDFSFYLAPHKAIQGTSRAPYIYMICDDIGFSQDSAQAMIHALSYLSPRCTKSTSIPTPVNLADLAAEQGKNLVICWNDYVGSRIKLTDEERLKELNAFLDNMADSNYKNTLYYI